MLVIQTHCKSENAFFAGYECFNILAIAIFRIWNRICIKYTDLPARRTLADSVKPDSERWREIVKLSSLKCHTNVSYSLTDVLVKPTVFQFLECLNRKSWRPRNSSSSSVVSVLPSWINMKSTVLRKLLSNSQTAPDIINNASFWANKNWLFLIYFHWLNSHLSAFWFQDFLIVGHWKIFFIGFLFKNWCRWTKVLALSL